MCQAFFGRCCHWGPIAALVIIKWVTLTTVYCNTMWWPPESGPGGLANMIGFMALAVLTTFHYVAAMCDGPGFVPLKWRPSDPADEASLQFCESCQGFKAPRAHHCRKCGRCVMKMDHHCPWINTCVGHRNHGHFVGFLAFAVLGSIQGAYTLAMSLYYGLNRSWYHYYGTGREPQVHLTLASLVVILFGLGLAIGVVLAVGALLFFQLRSIARNQTGIEDWIMEKAAYRLKGTDAKFLNPYDLGKKKNLGLVLRAGCFPVGDGVEWPLREGASKYDLTEEQMRQKEDKRHRTREYKIVMPYSGSWMPVWSMGASVGCRPPCTDEPRIRVEKGDHVRVTRWKKYWLYGDKVLDKTGGDGVAPAATAGAADRVRGWFPRRCAVDFVDNSVAPAVAAAKPAAATASGGGEGNLVGGDGGGGVRKREGKKKKQ